MKPSKSLILNRSGQAMSEYIIIVMLIAVASITVATSLGKQVHAKIKQASETIDRDVTLKAVRGE